MEAFTDELIKSSLTSSISGVLWHLIDERTQQHEAFPAKFLEILRGQTESRNRKQCRIERRQPLAHGTSSISTDAAGHRPCTIELL